MTLSISETFDDRRFLLDEAKFRKVVELATKRLHRTALGSKIEYEVERKDGSNYSTSDIDEVLSESDIESTRIHKLAVLVRGATLDVGVIFDVGEFARAPVRLSIKGDNRELVMLTGADLREYIDGEILVRRFPTRWFAVVPVIVSCYLIAFSVRDNPSSSALPSISDILKNPDLAVKLNYLLQRQESSSVKLTMPLWAGAMFACGFIMTVWLLVFNPQWDFIVRGNMFLIGKERERYDRLIVLSRCFGL